MSGPRELPSVTRSRVASLREQGLSYIAIARRLDLGKSTVAYHARRLGEPADDRFARRYDWDEIQRAVDEEGLSLRQCMARFGFCRDAWGKAVKRGELVPREWVIPIDELLVAGPRRNRGHIKRRLLAEGLKVNRCEECGLTEWRGRPLNMALHHVNGDGSDNRLENLVLLCPNCHAQTPNYGGRNGHRRSVARENATRPVDESLT
jgi:HNH endonuclease